MSLASRRVVTAALDAAGWTSISTQLSALLLRHTSGAVWETTTQAGDCALSVPGGPIVAFHRKVPNAVVIAACLAAAGQLDQAPPTETARAVAENDARSTVVSVLMAEATTASEINAMTRLALRAGLLWRCQPCRRDHYVNNSVCSCGTRRPGN